MKYDILLLDFFIFLLFNSSDSQITSNSETVRGSSGKEPNQIKSDRAIHESYRPRHKYKAGTGHQGFLRRFARSNTDGPQCAVMYKNNEPVGILQPYEDSYRFLQVKGEPTLVDINPIPIKRKTIMDVLYPSEFDEEDGSKVSDTVGFSDDKYPSVFAKFRVDSRLAKSWTPENYMKRSLFKREHSKDELPVESENTDVNVGDFAVEDQLRTILDDMGLIDDYPNRNIKRDIEDENLELGTNRINLFKEDHTENRDKRDNLNSTEEPVEIPSNLTVKFEKAPASKMSEDSENEVEMNGENTIHEKREIIEAHEKMISEDTTAIGMENEGEGPHETRIERAIRDKIHKLKEEVKKEIDKLRGKIINKKKENKDEKGKKDKGKKPKKPFSEDTRRKKRQTINTLIDEENEDIDPIITFNDENEAVHVRKKRNTDFDDVESLMGDAKYISRSLKQYNVSTMNARDTSNAGDEVNHASEFMQGYEEEPNEQSDPSVYENFGMSNEDSSRINSYEYDESEFDNDNSYEEVINDDPKTRVTHEKDTCNCDHNSNECKCSIPSSIDRQQSESKHKLNMSPQEVAGDSSTEHCSCERKGNCNCASSLPDGPEAAINEDNSSDFDENDEEPSELRSSKYEMDKRNAQVSTDMKEHCSCNKNGDCKCGSAVHESEPLLDQDYSAFQREADHGSNPEEIEGVGSEIETNGKISRRAAKPRKEAMKNFPNGEYFVDFHPARYRLGENSRRKRENFEDMVAIHGGRPVKEHLTAIRERSMVPFRRISARRVRKEDNNSEPRQLIDMSDDDIFGALPQGFEGGLQRYKRVKRT